MILFFFLFFFIPLFSLERYFEMNEIQPAYLQEQEPLLVRSNSFDSVFIYSDEDEQSYSSDDEPFQIRQRKKPAAQTPLTQDDLFRLIKNKDHEKIMTSRHLISLALINKRYKDQGIRPLTCAALHNAPKEVFKALFICGADPDFNDEKDVIHKSLWRKCYECFFCCLSQQPDPPNPRSARGQIRELFHAIPDTRDHMNKPPKESLILLKVLTNLHIKSTHRFIKTWRREALDYAQEQGIIIPSNPKPHIPIIE
ncbi:hypothetical protein K9K77_01640 [Candidatus Babeliales bacterium]|nr:hypothetical protein [Candidatus Babeliales bacterium]